MPATTDAELLVLFSAKHTVAEPASRNADSSILTFDAAAAQMPAHAQLLLRALQLQPFSEMTMRAHGMRKTIKTVWLSHATTYPLEYLSVAQPAALSQSLTV